MSNNDRPRRTQPRLQGVFDDGRPPRDTSGDLFKDLHADPTDKRDPIEGWTDAEIEAYFKDHDDTRFAPRTKRHAPEPFFRDPRDKPALPPKGTKGYDRGYERAAANSHYGAGKQFVTDPMWDRADGARKGFGREERTSANYPIYLDYIAPRALAPYTGRLGMTFLPGKVDPAGTTASWKRDLQADMKRLRETEKMTLLVSLVEDHELQSLKCEKLVDVGESLGIEVIRYPVRDVSIPPTIAHTKNIVRRVVDALAEGRTVGTHCRGGLGRAGLFTACVLVELGYDPATAMVLVRAARKGTIQTASQEQYVRDYATNHTRTDARL